VCRKIAVARAKKGNAEKIEVSKERAREYLGAPKFEIEEGNKKPQVGTAIGLAWTSVGGVTLSVETALSQGKGEVKLTGKLGEVMKESAHAAFSWLRSRSGQLGLKPDFHKEVDIHIHVPEGAVPKDGPSAGITLASSLASALLGIPVKTDVCMTGEITLRGRVLPIGGLREKLLAARRSGMKTVLIPEDNEKDLKEVPEEIVRSLDIRLVSDADDVLPLVLDAPREEIFCGEPSTSFLHSLRTARTCSQDLSGAVL
jgi:ATP-dependent Lon protease